MSGGPERIPVVVEKDHDAIATRVAGRIAEIVRERAGGRGAVLGLAS